jgi:hypothetical protein
MEKGNGQGGLRIRENGEKSSNSFLISTKSKEVEIHDKKAF